jgi:hypothetical protein
MPGLPKSRFKIVLALIAVLVFGGLAWFLGWIFTADVQVAAANPIQEVRVSPPAKMVSISLDTSAFRTFEEEYSLMLMVRVKDDSVDPLTDNRIAKSDPFEITGKSTTVRVNLTEDFVKRADAAQQQFGDASLQCFIALVPKDVRPAQISTMMDVPIIGGRRVHITDNVKQ